MNRRMRTLAAAACGLLTLSGVVRAETFIWTGEAGADWHNPLNWDRKAVPPDGADVVVGSGSVLLTNATAELASFTMNSGTLTFSNWTTRLSATEIELQGGTVTHFENTAAAAPWTPDARVWLACSTFTLGASASITLDSRGYVVNAGYWDGGRGPGGAIAGSNFGGAGGGGHGGRGGGLGDGGPTNGLAHAPENPGSSGGKSGGTAGKGGGALRIDADGAVTVDGTISANGQNANVGAGSGGSVWITCRTIAGGGVIRANGGDNTHSTGVGGGGGGGRIAVIYDTAAQAALPLPGIAYAVNGGSSTGVEDELGDIGTLYFSDTRFLSETITWPGQWVIPGFNGWAPATLTVSNVWSRFPADGFTCAVAGDVTVAGANGRLDIGGTHYDTFEGRTMSTNATPQRLYVGGDLDLIGGGKLYAYAACTNDAFPDWGALVSVTSTVTVASGCRIYPNCHDENGGSPLFEVGALAVAGEGGMDADYRGYRTGQGTTYYQNGLGPGGGSGSSAGGGGGGGYGGHGGRLGFGGIANGAAEDASGPGSGGAYASGSRGGHGGGAIRVTAAGPIMVDGILSANGRNAQGGVQGGGGSGGSVFLRAGAFTAAPTASISAGGGNAAGTLGGAGGGGGRIAVWTGIRPADEAALLADDEDAVRYPLLRGDKAVDYPGAFTAAGGSGVTASGTDGTVVFLAVAYPAPGTVLLMR